MRLTNGSTRNNRIALFVLLALILTSCVRINTGSDSEPLEIGDMKNERQTAVWNGDGTADIDIDMGVGDLIVNGGASELVYGDFTWNILNWQPEIRQDGNKVTIDQGKRRGLSFEFGNDAKNLWEVTLNDDAPINLTADLGVGTSTFDLTTVNLQSVDINGGAGELSVDLSGVYDDAIDVRIDAGVGEIMVDLSGQFGEDVTVKIDSGVGETIVYLPTKTGVRVNVDKGIGSVDAAGLLHMGNDEYTNTLYGETDATVDIDIDAGVGSIVLKTAE